MNDYQRAAAGDIKLALKLTNAPAGYDDILLYSEADQAERAEMNTGCHFDYKAQTYVDGHDHAHTDNTAAPLMFCGAAVESCLVAQAIIAWCAAECPCE